MVQQLMPNMPANYKPIGNTWREEMHIQVRRPDSVYGHNATRDDRLVIETRKEKQEVILSDIEAHPDDVPDEFISQKMIDDFRWDLVERVRHVYPEGFDVEDMPYRVLRARRQGITRGHQHDFLGTTLEEDSVLTTNVDSHAWKVAFPHFATNPLDVVLLWMCLPERTRQSQLLPSGALLMGLKERLEAQGLVQAKIVASIVAFAEIARGLFNFNDTEQKLVRPFCVSPLPWRFHRAAGHPYENIIHELFHLEKMADIAHHAAELKVWRRRQRILYDAYDQAFTTTGIPNVSTIRIPTVSLRELILEGESLSDIKKLEMNVDIRTRLVVPPNVLRAAHRQLKSNKDAQVLARQMEQMWSVLSRR